MSIDTNDPFAVADSAQPKAQEYFGQVKADAYFVYFAGGGAKPVPFDAAQHPADKKATSIDIEIIPLAEHNATWQVKRNYTDFSPDWAKVTLQSIKALGLNGLRELNNRFVRVALVDGSRKKPDGTFWSIFRFMEVYQDETACKAAFVMARGAASSVTPPPATNSEKDTALQFARAVVKNACLGKSDIAAIQAEVSDKISQMPLINAHFTADSPEIINLIMQAMSGK